MYRIIRKYNYNFSGSYLRIRVKWHGKELTVGTGCQVDRKSAKNKPQWDGRRCLPGTIHGKNRIPAVVINAQLESLELRLEEIFYRYEVRGEVPETWQLKKELEENHNGSQTDDSPLFAKSFDKFLLAESTDKDWATNTIRSARQVKNLVLKRSPHLRVDQITHEWLRGFVEYQKHHKLSEKQFASGMSGYSNPVIAKNCRILKWYLKWAAEEGLIDSDVPERFKVNLKSVEKPVIFLTWDELMLLWNTKLEGILDKARDLFCFCCFTSLRYSDAVNLKKSQVTADAFTLTTVKTASLIKIELNKYSSRILEKYRKLPGEKALPFLSNYRLNYYLKQIGKQIGLDSPVNISQYYGSRRSDRTVPKYELLSSHCGRRTFICNALAMGITPNVVMKWTGHSEYSAMKPYIDIASDIREKSMKLFDQR